MNYQQVSACLNKPPPQPPPNERILLVDCDTTSRDIRTNALRARGAVVDCVGNGADALSLWKPGSHQLVLIEFRSAVADVYDFYRHVQATCSNQRFGFYTVTPPYLAVTSTAIPCEPAEEGCSSAKHRLQSLVREGALTARFRVGVPEAARQIALVRRAARSAADGGQGRAHPMSFSDSVRMAERALEGGS